MEKGRNFTSKKGTTAIKGDAFHNPMFQILLYHFWEISLQWVFTKYELQLINYTLIFLLCSKTHSRNKKKKRQIFQLKVNSGERERKRGLPIIEAFIAFMSLHNQVLLCRVKMPSSGRVGSGRLEIWDLVEILKEEACSRIKECTLIRRQGRRLQDE